MRCRCRKNTTVTHLHRSSVTKERALRRTNLIVFSVIDMYPSQSHFMLSHEMHTEICQKLKHPSMIHLLQHMPTILFLLCLFRFWKILHIWKIFANLSHYFHTHIHYICMPYLFRQQPLVWTAPTKAVGWTFSVVEYFTNFWSGTFIPEHRSIQIL